MRAFSTAYACKISQLVMAGSSQMEILHDGLNEGRIGQASDSSLN